MRRIALPVVLAVVFAGCGEDAPAPKPPTKAPRIDPLTNKLARGQVWQYKTRPQELNSRLIIGKVEALPSKGRVVHIKLVKLRVKNAGAPGGFSTVASHLPIAEDVLRKSLTSLERKTGGDLSGFSEGYTTWRKANKAGKAGAFSVPVSEVVKHLETTINSGRAVKEADQHNRSKDILSRENAAQMTKDTNVEVYYAVHDSTGTHETGVWLLAKGEKPRAIV